MKLGKDVQKILSRTYEPDIMVTRTMGRYDLAFKTDDAGRPILLFIGKANEQGKIRGEWFSRRLLTDETGLVIKDHWDNKGKIN